MHLATFGEHCASSNSDCGRFTNTVKLCGHGLGQFRFDQNMGQRDAVTNMERLADVINSKRVRWDLIEAAVHRRL